MTTTMNGVFNSDTDSNSPNTPASASTEVNTVNVPTPPQNNPNGIGIHSGLESLNETLNVQFNNDIDIDITGKKQNTKTNTSLNMSTSTNTNTKKNKKTKKMIRIPKKIVEEATRTDETTTRTTETAQAFSTTQTTPGGAVNAETNEEKEGAQAQIPQTQKPPLVGGAANVEINETPSRSNGNSFHTGLTQPMNNVTMNNVNVNNIGTSVEKQDTSMIKENGDSTIAQNSIPNTTNTNTNGNPNENDNKNDSKTNITNDTGNDIEEEEEEDIDIDITMISASNTAPSTTTTINPTTTTGNSNSNSNPTTNDNTNLNTNETKTTDEKDDLKLESNTDANDTVMTTLDSDINSNNTATRPDVTSNIASNDLSARLEALYNSTERKEADTVMQAVAQKAGTHMIQICNDLKEDILDQCDDFGLEMRKEMEKWTLTRSWVQALPQKLYYFKIEINSQTAIWARILAVPKALEEYCKQQYPSLNSNNLEKNDLRDHGSDDKNFYGDPIPTAKNSSLIWFPSLWESLYAPNNNHNNNSNDNSNNSNDNSNHNISNNTPEIEWTYSAEGVQVHPVNERFTPF